MSTIDVKRIIFHILVILGSVVIPTILLLGLVWLILCAYNASFLPLAYFWITLPPIVRSLSVGTGIGITASLIAIIYFKK